MDTPPSLPPRNMRVGLVIFGILSILLGALCLTMIPAMLLGNLVPVKGRDPTPLPMILSMVLTYGFIAVVDIWLGIGSIRCSRWARTLLLLWSLFWLLAGTFSLVIFGLISGQMDAAFAQTGTKMPPGFTATFKVLMFLFMSVIYVVLPASFTWFYSLTSTRLTCENHCPSPSWTDRCPLAVLALALLAGMWMLCLPFMMIYAPVFPFFGIYIEGLPAVLILVVMAASFGWTAWGLYNLKITAWWLDLVLVIVFVTSYMITFSNGGLMELYRHMHIPAQTMKLLEASPFLQSNWIALSGFLFLVPYLGLSLYARKFFVSAQTAG